MSFAPRVAHILAMHACSVKNPPSFICGLKFKLSVLFLLIDDSNFVTRTPLVQ